MPTFIERQNAALRQAWQSRKSNEILALAEIQMPLPAAIPETISTPAKDTAINLVTLFNRLKQALEHTQAREHDKKEYLKKIRLALANLNEAIKTARDSFPQLFEKEIKPIISPCCEAHKEVGKIMRMPAPKIEYLSEQQEIYVRNGFSKGLKRIAKLPDYLIREAVIKFRSAGRKVIEKTTTDQLLDDLKHSELGMRTRKGYDIFEFDDKEERDNFIKMVLEMHEIELKKGNVSLEVPQVYPDQNNNHQMAAAPGG